MGYGGIFYAWACPRFYFTILISNVCYHLFLKDVHDSYFDDCFECILFVKEFLDKEIVQTDIY